MKLYLIAALLFVAVCAVFAAPSPGENPFDYAVGSEHEGRSGRHARATCNLRKLTGNAPCIGHCAWLGKAGGTCRGDVCVCSGESLRDALRRHHLIP